MSRQEFTLRGLLVAVLVRGLGLVLVRFAMNRDWAPDDLDALLAGSNDVELVRLVMEGWQRRVECTDMEVLAELSYLMHGSITLGRSSHHFGAACTANKKPRRIP